MSTQGTPTSTGPVAGSNRHANKREPTISAGVLASALAIAATVGSAVLGGGPAAAGPPPITPFITPTPVSACGTLSAPGGYVLTTNLGPIAGTCLVVAAPHVTLNLAGHSVTGTKLPGSYGILLLPSAVAARVGSTRPGAAVSGFHAGIQDDANAAVIKGPNLLFSDNAGAGVFLYKAVASVVEGAGLDGNGQFGINVQSSQGAVIRSNDVGANGTYGIWAQGSTASRIVNNRVENSGLAGIYLGCSDTGNLQDVGCRPSDSSLIEGNALVGNGEFGVAISDESLNNRADANRASGDKQKDLWDENYHCEGASTLFNSWQQNIGTRNQAVSPTCIG